MDDDVQQEAERVDEDVALATRDLLACVIARRIDRRRDASKHLTSLLRTHLDLLEQLRRRDQRGTSQAAHL
jgi:hypothetical protein